MENKTVNPIKLVEQRFSEYFKGNGIKFRVSKQNYILVKTHSIFSKDFSERFIQEIGAVCKDTDRLKKENLRFDIGTGMNDGKCNNFLLKERTCCTGEEINEVDKEINNLWRNERNGYTFFIPQIGIMRQMTFDGSKPDWSAIPIEMERTIATVINNVVGATNRELFELEQKDTLLKIEEEDKDPF